MKKEDVAGLLIYMVIFAVAVVYGLAILQPYYSQSSFSSPLLFGAFILGGLAVGVIGSAVLLELGHLLGAKLGHYTVLSTCVLYFKFYRDNEKWKFKFSSYDGFVGETKILPKSEKSNPNHYLLMGTLFTSIFTIACIIAFYFLKDYSGSLRDFAYFFLTAGGAGLVVILYNIIPIKLDSINDGHRLSMVSNPRNKEAFNELLRVEYEIAQGNTNVEIKTFTELTNFTADLNMNKVYILLDKQEYEQALELIELVINNKQNVSNRVYLRALAMKINLLAFTKNEEEFAKYVADNCDMDLRKEIFDDASFVSIRAYVLLSGIVDNSKSECVLSLGKAYKAYKSTPKNRRNSEITLYNKCLDMVLVKHPKWEELNKYRFELEEKK